MSTYVIVEHNGSYDAYAMTPLCIAFSKEKAETLVDLLNEYAKWIEDSQKKKRAFQSKWREKNPPTWTGEEYKKFCHRTYSFAGMKNGEDYKDFDKRKEQWNENFTQAIVEFNDTIICPDNFAKIDERFGGTYNDNLSYSYYELETFDI